MKTRPADWGSPPAVPGAQLAYVLERVRLRAAEDHATERHRKFEDVAADAQRTTASVDALVAEHRRTRELEDVAARDLAEREHIARTYGLDLEDVS